MQVPKKRRRNISYTQLRFFLLEMGPEAGRRESCELSSARFAQIRALLVEKDACLGKGFERPLAPVEQSELCTRGR